MGMGHAVYKTYDPRAQCSKRAFKETSRKNWISLGLILLKK